ncbi:flagellar biosynthetic protein (FlhB)-like protein [Thermosinus carboxydivorans Nor1]|uniref:Flagellar biosynthetic protein (FlhB)-like protein n=1 Tax=Thermosinus carboxydivorans Nor1 TaxID=401526 RepID=A1HN65_9FIRM|nr:EscU/YscU/HrcU family type III secretion system export apparatus switch protein [Thermosinus carboxydivorans]EAX48691.1 flagellar biosynthetic protein (FlhB)-like protein [Thermosinus carboxydivorans Nor1]
MNNSEQARQKQAIALRYDQQTQQAPKVVAKGSGYVAEQILATAAQHAVPVYKDTALASLLMAVELDKEIPPELYQVVAEVLAYIYRVDRRFVGSKG